MPEKSITRYDCETETRNPGYLSYEVAVMEEWPDGDWVKYEDHLDALGEAEKAVAAEEQHRLEVQRACIAANQKLQTITAGLEAEVERLRMVERDCLGEIKSREREERERNLIAEGRAGTARFAADRLQALLDQAETAGAE